MKDTELLTFAECRKLNRQTGLGYIQMSKKFKNIAEKYKKHEEMDSVIPKEQFEAFYQMYLTLSEKASDIGNRLCSC